MRSSGQYAVRRATVVLVVLLLATGITSFAVGRDRGEAPISDRWNVVVAQDAAGNITVVDATGDEVRTVPGSWRGVLEVGPQGTVVLGADGVATAAALGVLDVSSGSVDEVAVDLDSVLAPWPAPYLVAFDFGTAGLQIIDVAARTGTDLSGLLGPTVPDFTQMLLDPGAGVVAFTGSDGRSTVAISLADRSVIRHRGALVDAFGGRLLTLEQPSGGERTSLVLSDAADTDPLASVELDVLAAMLTGDAGAVAVTRAGEVYTIEFDLDSGRATATRADDLGPVLRGPVSSAVIRVDRERLVVFARDVAVALDRTGRLTGTFALDHDAPVAARLETAHRCALVYGTSRDPASLIDALDGAVLGTIDASIVLDRSEDGCTVAFRPVGSSTSSRILGPGLDRVVDGLVTDLAPDASAALVARADGVSLLVLGSDDDRGGSSTGVLVAPGAVDAVLTEQTLAR